jgi:hypothetical protein
LHELLSLASGGVRGSEKSEVSADRWLLPRMHREAGAKELSLVEKFSKQTHINS